VSIQSKKFPRCGVLTAPDAVASPGYFAQTLDNDIMMEATATRRAGLERFTFPDGSKPYFVLDLANDLPNSFAGGSMNIDPVKGQITIGGLWGSRCVLLPLRKCAANRPPV
jgi:hypothetical protein